MNPRYALVLGLLMLMFVFWPRHTDTLAHTPWLGPEGTRWAGTELRGMQRWGGYFSNAGIAGEYLELRCRRLPLLRTRREYWPGPEWRGWAEWQAEGVVYRPAWKKPTSKIQSVGLAAPWWLSFCR